MAFLSLPSFHYSLTRLWGRILRLERVASRGASSLRGLLNTRCIAASVFSFFLFFFSVQSSDCICLLVYARNDRLFVKLVGYYLRVVVEKGRQDCTRDVNFNIWLFAWNFFLFLEYWLRHRDKRMLYFLC